MSAEKLRNQNYLTSIVLILTVFVSMDAAATKLVQPGHERVVTFSSPQDWRKFDGLEFNIDLSEDAPIRLNAEIQFDYANYFETLNEIGAEIIVYPEKTDAAAVAKGKGEHLVRIPLDHFQSRRNLPGSWEYVKAIRVTPEWVGQPQATAIEVGGVQPYRFSPIEMSCDALSQPVDAGETQTYSIEIQNFSDETQAVHLSLLRDGDEVLDPRLSEDILNIGPGDNEKFTLQVRMTDDISVGGYEDQVVLATPEGKGEQAVRLRLRTVRYRPHPYLLLTEEGFQEVKDKIIRYDWARKTFEGVVNRADLFPVPAIADTPRSVYGDWGEVIGIVDVAVAWKLSGEQRYAEKLTLFLRNLLDPQRGYFARGNAVSGAGVGIHEGMGMSLIAIVYDIVRSGELLKESEIEELEAMFRDFNQKADEFLKGRLIYNYSTGPNAGAILCALAIQDLLQLDRQIHGTGGFYYQIGNGVMDDGWHMEGATNYHVLILRYYINAIQACQNWGIDLYDAQVPTIYARQVEQGTAFEGYLGMSFQKWGPPGRNYRCIKDMLDALLPFMDHNTVVIANNDSRTHKVGDVYEQAYAHYRDPAYAWVINQCGRQGYSSLDDYMHTGWRHLLYGVPEVPQAPDPRNGSAVAKNIGLGVLRSQKEGRAPEQQIMAVLKWGTHGGWHGHFDRISLLALQRYETDFYYPWAAFDGYMRDQYKMWDQASANHNMVIVDELMQEPVESDLLFFGTSKALQACAAQTVARWSQVPDWMNYFPPKFGPEQQESGIFFNPRFEPVLQRRMLMVTDDYVVIADYLDSEQEHTYDCLFHPVGFEEMTAVSKELLRQQPRASEEKVSSYKYITDCSWYEVTSPVNSRFADGILKTDIHTLWPRKMEMMLGHYPKGDEQKDRYTLLARSRGKEASFLTVLEPYSEEKTIESVDVESPRQFTVHLSDGRSQAFTIEGFFSDQREMSVVMEETREGIPVRKVGLSGR